MDMSNIEVALEDLSVLFLYSSSCILMLSLQIKIRMIGFHTKIPGRRRFHRAYSRINSSSSITPSK